MKILVLNSGSSSLKFKLYEMENKKLLALGHIEGIGREHCYVTLNDKKEERKVHTYEEAIAMALDEISNVCPKEEITAIGHRVVHGGEFYKEATLITDEVIKVIEDLSELAPLHNPPNLKGIYACKKELPNIPQVAVFDTAFHQTIPKKAYLYAIPMKFYDKYKIRKYGFHGTSHKYLANKANEILGKSLKSITCHLGNGASIAAIKDMKSMDTSMGFTPLQGLIMGTRSGDIDPEVVEFLMKKEDITIHRVLRILNKQSGLLGLEGTPDMREIHERAIHGDEQAKLAIDVFAYHVIEYLGSYDVVLEGAEAIIFSGGIGENAWFVREQICKNLECLGVKIDLEKNKENETIISTPDSKIAVLVIPTNEEEQIATETEMLLERL
ncbi:MAG: acetate kinase [archaeon]